MCGLRETDGGRVNDSVDGTGNNTIDMGEMEDSFFLIGLLSEFMNRFQAAGDTLFGEISWKQCFALVCIGFFENPPTLKELSDMLGTSHQNVKQMLLKLNKAGFVELISDDTDKRKQRILLTDKARQFSAEHNEVSEQYMKQLFATVDPKDLKVTVATILKLDDQLKKMQQEM